MASDYGSSDFGQRLKKSAIRPPRVQAFMWTRVSKLFKQVKLLILLQNCECAITTFFVVAAGPCRAALTRYAFDKDVGSCREFLFGGCEVDTS